MKYSNLHGWCRDVKAALAAGEELSYEAAELVEALLDLVTEDADGDLEDDRQDELAGSARPGSDSLADGQLQLGGTPRVGDPLRARGQRQDADPEPQALARAHTGLSRPVTFTAKGDRSRGT